MREEGLTMTYLTVRGYFAENCVLVLIGILCGHEFCYECLVDYEQIIKWDNTLHEDTCPWHPDNMEGLGYEY